MAISTITINRKCEGIKTSLIEGANKVHTWDICGVWTSQNFVDAMANGTLFYSPGSSQGHAITMNNSTGGAGFLNQSVSGFFPINTSNPNLSQLYPFTLSHFSNPLNPLYSSNTEAWYDYVVSQLGPINIGDTIVIDTEPYGYPILNPYFTTISCTHPGIPVFHVEKICLVYKGLDSVPFPLNISHMTLGDPNFTPIPAGTPMPGFDIYNGPCCSEFPDNPHQISSWDCVQVGDHPKFGFKCVEIQGTNGQYATKQECLNAGCKEIDPDPGIPTISL